MKKFPIITAIYGLICIIIFIILNLYTKNDIITLIDFGAKTNFKIVDFNFTSLIASSFIHSDTMHIASNMISLYYIGPFTENFLGKTKYIIFIIFSAIISTLGSFIFSNTISLGASGVIFAFLGIHLFLYIEYRENYKEIFGSGILHIIILNLIITFVGKNIDAYGHIFGLISGIIFMGFTFDNNSKYITKKISILALALILIGSGIKFNMFKYSKEYFYSKAYYLMQKNDKNELNKLEKEFIKKFPNGIEKEK